MKNLYFKLIFILAIGIFAWSCSDDDTGASNNQPRVRFLQEELNIPASAGEVIVLLESLSTPWKIVMDNENGIITKISQTQGGDSESGQQFTKIKFLYKENTSYDTRLQEVFLVNKNTQERSKLTIVQRSLYPSLTISLDPTVKYQAVAGFGGMYNPKIWLGSNLITEAELDKMYAPDQLGYNILRLMIYPKESDWTADVAAAKKALEHGAIIFASPWDCTDALAEEIKIEGKDEVYKHLKKENYQAYTDHLIKYINFMRSNGVNIYAVSVQNEPDMHFTYWYPQEVVDYIKEYGDQIRATGVKLMAPEACGMQPEYTDPVLNDADAFSKTDIVAGHIYQGFIKKEESNYVKNRHDYICGLYNKKLAASGKTWWMTEHLFNDGQDESDPSKWEFNKWNYNLSTLGKEIHMCMEGYCSAYIYWYLKRFYGMMSDNDERSLAAPGEILKNGYILSHYAKFASGMTRIKIQTGNPDLLATAYTNESNNEITLVLLNMGNEKLNTRIPISGIKKVYAVETTEERDMEEVTVGTLNSTDGVYTLVSPLSITSIRLDF